VAVEAGETVGKAVEAGLRLIHLIRHHADLAHHGTGCDDSTVRVAEQLLGAAFPPSYRRLIAEFGTWDIGGAEFLGVYRTTAMGGTLLGSVAATLDARRQYGMPDDLIAVAYDGMGNILVLDTSQPDSDGEYPVLAWNPGVRNRADMEKLGTDFGTVALTMCQRALRR
jgi:hypothetical protein